MLEEYRNCTHERDAQGVLLLSQEVEQTAALVELTRNPLVGVEIS